MRLLVSVRHMLRFPRPTPVLEPREAYARWAPVYPARAHNALMRVEQRVTEALLGGIRAERVLDVGTGTGRYRPVLSRAGARHIVAVDFSWEMLTAGRNTGPGAVVCGDAVALPLADAVFDLALASLMVGDVADLAPWVKEIHRVLRPGGHLLFSDFHESWAGDGWRRTLEDRSGRSFEIPYHPRSVRHHCRALDRGGFIVDEVRETGLDGETGVDAESFRHRWGNPPVAVVVHAHRYDPAVDPPRSRGE